MREQTFLGNFFFWGEGGCFTWGLRGFKGQFKLVFPLIDPDLGY